ncbi:helix-turn-helix transcriptional regulator [Natrinema amylolyticum]|uniref:helix-turn-helix transcriptional regulator n=1 Tax=Natrinema amylolyticum TaxID=2878679 RepID=UPI001CF97482|nr:hypothetical protein [Natrinema amylolyticum]
MNRPVSVGLVVLVILASVAGVSGSVALTTAGLAAQSAADPATADPSPFVSQERDWDDTTFDITVYENGSATWTFRHERLFANEENATEAERNFRAFAEAFEANETGRYEAFINQSNELAAAGSQETGREMDATNFNRSIRVDEGRINPRGVVEMSFTWTNFAAVEGETIVVGDVFRDLYLAPDQSIELEAGGDLQFRSVAPEPDGRYDSTSLENTGSVEWSGERQFADGRPRAELTSSTGGAVGNDNQGLVGAMSGDIIWYLLGLLVTGAGIAAVVWYRRYGPGAGDTAVGTATDRSAESTAPAADATTDSSADAGATAVDDTGAGAPLSDEDLMTDEDRVVTLIRENGGRMKQVNIVEETGWSKSKVSMLLSDMEDEGTISKLRVGRENIISLEGFEPEATKSPFEE